MKRDEVDWVLAGFVRLAETDGIGVGVTLAVGGILVTGTLISSERYFELFAQEFDFDGAEKLAASIRRIGGNPLVAEDAGIGPDANPEEIDRSTKWPRYVHLEGARILLADGRCVPENRAVNWRCSLAAVDGFCPGVMAPANPVSSS